MWQKLSKHYPVHLELIPLLLLGSAFYLVATSYALLPDSIPTHFGARRTPDEWGSRSSIFIFPGISAVLYIFLSFFNVLLALAKDPKRYINLPRKRLENLTPVLAEKLMIFLNRSLFAMKVFMLGLTLYSIYITIEVAMGRAASLGAPFFVLLAGILVVVIYMTWRSFRLTATARRPVQ
jgi:uncharacterized membrane protein